MDAKGDELAELLREVVGAVEAADVPEDLRERAFEKAFDLAVGKQAALDGDPQPEESTSAVAETPLAKLASRLGLETFLVEESFYWDGDSLGLALPPARFSPRKAAATKQIALLITAGRQAAGLEEWTSTRDIREVVRDYGRFDSGNFATTIRSMGDVFSFRGRGHDLYVRVTRPGFDRAAGFLRELRAG